MSWLAPSLIAGGVVAASYMLARAVNVLERIASALERIAAKHDNP